MMQKLAYKARLTYQTATDRGCHTLLVCMLNDVYLLIFCCPLILALISFAFTVLHDIVYKHLMELQPCLHV
jgi:hypothetical protein